MIVATHDIGTHSVFIVELRSIVVADASNKPLGLVYFNRDDHVLNQAA